MHKHQISFFLFNGRQVEITRKNMKNMILRVAPGGLLKVSCPYRTKDKQIEDFIRAQWSWVEAQKPKAQEPALKDGGTFLLFEEKLIIHALPGCAPTVRDGRQLRIYVKDPTDREQIEKKVRQYQRDCLRDYITMRLPVWERIVGRDCFSWNIRNMKTRWGSCNTSKKSLLFSLKLAEKPLICTDLVIAHELTHLHERKHSARFYALLDRFMPGWRMTEEILHESKEIA